MIYLFYITLFWTFSCASRFGKGGSEIDKYTILNDNNPTLGI